MLKISYFQSNLVRIGLLVSKFLSKYLTDKGEETSALTHTLVQGDLRFAQFLGSRLVTEGMPDKKIILISDLGLHLTWNGSDEVGYRYGVLLKDVPFGKEAEAANWMGVLQRLITAEDLNLDTSR